MPRIMTYTFAVVAGDLEVVARTPASGGLFPGRYVTDAYLRPLLQGGEVGVLARDAILVNQFWARQEYRPGRQIMYIPPWAVSQGQRDTEHSDVQDGFITSVDPVDRTAMCRFWQGSQPWSLRTTANSEQVSWAHLRVHLSHDDAHVRSILAKIDEEEQRFL